MRPECAAYGRLADRFRRVASLDDAIGMLHWDRQSVMPQGGAEARTETLAALAVLRHETISAPDLGELIAKAGDEPLDEWQSANLREIGRLRAHATALPGDLVHAYSRARTRCETIWQEDARPNGDFAAVRESLGTVVDLTREVADARAARLGVSAYDALLDAYEPGGRTARIDALFAPLAAGLSTLLPAILDRQEAAAAVRSRVPVERQRALGRSVMDALGFDFRRGRLDTSAHPFSGGGPDDTRITTRYDEADWSMSLMGVIHETGHALYEQGLPKTWRRQPVGSARGMVLHESQSLLFEMQVSRSRPFFTYLAPLVRRTFGVSGPEWEAEALHRAASRVARGPIRVDADEVTYPFHIFLRYRLERDLLSGALPVAALPEAWNAGMRDLLGVDPADDGEGCLQDVHWYGGAFGYFPTYALGALAAAQLFAAARAAVPGLDRRIEVCDLTPLVAWLRRHVHGSGSLKTTDEILCAATGSALDAAPFLDHVRRRYLEA